MTYPLFITLPCIHHYWFSDSRGNIPNCSVQQLLIDLSPIHLSSPFLSLAILSASTMSWGNEFQFNYMLHKENVKKFKTKTANTFFENPAEKTNRHHCVIVQHPDISQPEPGNLEVKAEEPLYFSKHQKKFAQKFGQLLFCTFCSAILSFPFQLFRAKVVMAAVVSQTAELLLHQDQSSCRLCDSLSWWPAAPKLLYHRVYHLQFWEIKSSPAMTPVAWLSISGWMVCVSKYNPF